MLQRHWDTYSSDLLARDIPDRCNVSKYMTLINHQHYRTPTLFIFSNIWWFIIRSARSCKEDYNLTVQENLSEKEDELLQCSRWLPESQEQKIQYLSFNVDSGRKGEEERREIQLILRFAALWGFMIYISRIRSVIVRSRSEWQMIIYCH